MLDLTFAHGPSPTPTGELVEPGEPAASKPTVAPDGRPDPPPTTSARESARQPSLAGWLDRRGRGDVRTGPGHQLGMTQHLQQGPVS
jgi:hypothetical protein